MERGRPRCDANGSAQRPTRGSAMVQPKPRPDASGDTTKLEWPAESARAFSVAASRNGAAPSSTKSARTSSSSSATRARARVDPLADAPRAAATAPPSPSAVPSAAFNSLFASFLNSSIGAKGVEYEGIGISAPACRAQRLSNALLDPGETCSRARVRRRRASAWGYYGGEGCDHERKESWSGEEEECEKLGEESMRASRRRRTGDEDGRLNAHVCARMPCLHLRTCACKSRRMLAWVSERAVVQVERRLRRRCEATRRRRSEQQLLLDLLGRPLESCQQLLLRRRRRGSRLLRLVGWASGHEHAKGSLLGPGAAAALGVAAEGEAGGVNQHERVALRHVDALGEQRRTHEHAAALAGGRVERADGARLLRRGRAVRVRAGGDGAAHLLVWHRGLQRL
eukprot:112081-Pleurochrysis_carterae.AAC.3